MVLDAFVTNVWVSDGFTQIKFETPDGIEGNVIIGHTLEPLPDIGTRITIGDRGTMWRGILEGSSRSYPLLLPKTVE